MSSKVKLSPPWYTLYGMFQNTFGCDPHVTIGKLDTSTIPYRLPITVDDKQKGMSLQTIIRTFFQFGNISVKVDVGESWETIVIRDSAHLKEIFTTALTGNPLFVKSVAIPSYPGSFNFYSVAVIFTKSVVQFFNDDLSEHYHNYNKVTADVFADLMKMEFANLHVQRGTAKE